ncbi:hypothetical protein CEXT_499881 [Caerostris extrusa]|uniref:Uncharacterized protein n=1 Tax=Caerostris extrusa TaxID=172846 RepID=A0AAV4U2I5_CAEEX|nr:hypothetical protein CEXT_499881 [Caerostris extrusa]
MVLSGLLWTCILCPLWAKYYYACSGQALVTQKLFCEGQNSRFDLAFLTPDLPGDSEKKGDIAERFSGHPAPASFSIVFFELGGEQGGADLPSGPPGGGKCPEKRRQHISRFMCHPQSKSTPPPTPSVISLLTPG